MTDYEIAFDAVHKVTGISKSKIKKRTRVWPVVEARMLWVMLLCKHGHKTLPLAWTLERDVSTISQIHTRAKSYASLSVVFRNKLDKITKLYESAKTCQQI